MNVLERKLDKTKTKNSYNNVVWFYNLWSWLTESKAAKKVIDLAEIEDGKRILEVACGTGVVFEQIVNGNPNGENIGIDLSPDMLNKARNRLKKVSDNFELREGDALNLDFDDNTFDILINNFMVDLMPQEHFDRIAQEFRRVLKPKGVLVISTFSFGKKRINKIWFWIAKHFPDLLTGCRPVSFKDNLIKAGFSIEQDMAISQNTFPSEVIKAIKIK
ncbi:MAG: methyltransferase domain-containing protein [Melioribacteraceae bacterium]|nr:methyltransferase domain-containing protein [Melioribacteraceae bacterium]MCF8394418.1 methyltransferase domain-containing protein [Melioribacteraceae bacterium]MCF8417486.1 methyltransferase domain-containing protein [Melioribacteraceae bacterium]